MIERDQEFDGSLPVAWNAREEFLHPRARRLRLEVGSKLRPQLHGILEGEEFRERLDEEVERIDDFEIGDEIDDDGKFVRLFRKNKAREPVPVRVLLPIHEMFGRGDLERIITHPRATVGSGPQPHHLGAEIDETVVTVAGDVMKVRRNRH